MARLTIADDGVGLAEGRAYPGSQGVGGRLVTAFAADLDGRIEVDGRNGTTVTMTLPITMSARRAGLHLPGARPGYRTTQAMQPRAFTLPASRPEPGGFGKEWLPPSID